jgi:hypothetical protein
MGYTNVRHYAGGKQDWMRHDRAALTELLGKKVVLRSPSPRRSGPNV